MQDRMTCHLTRALVAGSLALASLGATAAPIFWTDWLGTDTNPAAPFSAQGTITTPTSTVAASPETVVESRSAFSTITSNPKGLRVDDTIAGSPVTAGIAIFSVRATPWVEVAANATVPAVSRI